MLLYYETDRVINMHAMSIIAADTQIPAIN